MPRAALTAPLRRRCAVSALASSLLCDTPAECRVVFELGCCVRVSCLWHERAWPCSLCCLVCNETCSWLRVRRGRGSRPRQSGVPWAALHQPSALYETLAYHTALEQGGQTQKLSLIHI